MRPPILDAAAPGSVDLHVDPEGVFDMLLGAVLIHVMLPSASSRRRSVEHSVDMIMRLLRP
ncbi:hypothetical protein ACWD4G_36560 [Streptomyces sp. NPDC002643]